MVLLVNVTEQVPEVRVQLVALNEPGPVEVKVTVPAGGMLVPASWSVTVMVHVVVCPGVRVVGVQATTAVAARRFTVMLAAKLVLME